MICFNLLGNRRGFQYLAHERGWSVTDVEPLYLRTRFTLIVRGCGLSAPMLFYRKVGPRQIVAN